MTGTGNFFRTVKVKTMSDKNNDKKQDHANKDTQDHKSPANSQHAQAGENAKAPGSEEKQPGAPGSVPTKA